MLGPAAEGAAPLIESNQAPKSVAAAPKALDPKKCISFPLTLTLTLTLTPTLTLTLTLTLTRTSRTWRWARCASCPV